jgi:diguanylate cyclase (GGDEF)-like protein
MELLNLERQNHGMEPIAFKLASLNPRNPINRADAFEAKLLARMQANSLSQYQDVVTTHGQKWLYLAVPIERSGPGCMKCHGDPKDAPAELVARYGDKAGFYEEADSIRALISIRVPLQSVVRAADSMANALTWSTLGILSGIYLLIVFFTRRIDAQQRQILEQNAHFEQLSVTDSLTGVLNRLGLLQRCREVSNLADRFGHPLALLMIDLDHFKQINDSHGHPVGDAVLVRFTETVRAHMRVSDIFGRWGGEEFVVLAPHLSADEAMSLAEKLRQAIEQADFGPGIRVTASIGLAQYRAKESTAEMVERADRALYRAKAAGRNRCLSEAAD